MSIGRIDGPPGGLPAAIPAAEPTPLAAFAETIRAGDIHSDHGSRLLSQLWPRAGAPLLPMPEPLGARMPVPVAVLDAVQAAQLVSAPGGGGDQRQAPGGVVGADGVKAIVPTEGVAVAAPADPLLVGDRAVG